MLAILRHYKNLMIIHQDDELNPAPNPNELGQMKTALGAC